MSSGQNTNAIRLKVIPISHVITSKETDRTYNTNHHTRAEIDAVLPRYMHHYGKENFVWILLSPWLDLIVSSRRLLPGDIHSIILPPMFLSFLKAASNVGLILGRVGQEDMEDLLSTLSKTTDQGKDIARILQNKGHFLRLDACSLKDAIIGEGPIKDAKDICTRLATSSRGRNGIFVMQEEDPTAKVIKLYLFPWDEAISTEHEYRCYCAPASGQLTAISQYCWHRPWLHGKRSLEEQQKVAERLLRHCITLHKQIMEHAAMTPQQLSWGFVFDVIEDPHTQEVRLLELNEYGAMSGCGSCLFQWIKDARLLYGIDGDAVPKLRVAY